MNRAWWTACASMAGVSGAVYLLNHLFGSAWATGLDWQPEQVLRQPWRWWTAAWVHWNGLHLAANVLGCAVLAYWAQATQAPARWLGVWMLAWPLTHLLLLLEPRLAHYGGLSGVLHAGVAVVTCRALWLGVGVQRTLAGVVALGLVVKLVAERPWDWPVPVSPWWDFSVVTLAHATGAMAGLICATGMLLWERRGTIQACQT